MPVIGYVCLLSKKNQHVGELDAPAQMHVCVCCVLPLSQKVKEKQELTTGCESSVDFWPTEGGVL